ncbi:aldehyde dehydrogenase family protein [Pseudogemmobacter humi]|uniref:L-glutamate gamma-semialdehyde dehydrogenase n=1 Tax=Pseudogemmobacter humi TaxID=2483812 RepID=A0A3P5X089_9RHOB|nr:aldehyde dehydrogenase family protein [Pseudogemmobacter humi]VDC24730.1 Aldehyde dehydrogenase, thermostable [Pseudogemmobacter humi]
MTDTLPRVTYSNIGADFSPLHAFLDREIPAFQAGMSGKTWATPFATGPVAAVASPIDPALDLGRFPVSTEADVKAAIASARKGAAVWNKASLDERLAFAARWRAALDEAKYRLGIAALFEVGKSRIEAIGEADEAVDMLDYYPGELKANAGYRREMIEMVPGETAVSVQRPYGVFAVVAPFNFPVALSVGMLCGALLTGNAVVYKPSPECQLTGLLLAETLRKAGLPEGVFNIVLGGAAVGEALTTDPGIDGVVFTGSHKTGMSIFRHMATRPWMRPVIAEMGGKNPAYVTKHADIERAAAGVARSAYGLQGQKCSACSVVYVDNAVKERFVEAFRAFVAKLQVGDPRDGATFMGPLYNDAAAARFIAAMAEARAGGRVLLGGERIADLPGNYFAPALVEMDGPSRLTREELFMPFLVLRGVDGLEAALAEGNDVSYGLSAGIFSQDQGEISHFLAHAEAGVLYANRASGATTGAWPGGQPFCGWKGTGVGGKGGLGTWYLPQFMHEQSHTIMTV